MYEWYPASTRMSANVQSVLSVDLSCFRGIFRDCLVTHYLVLYSSRFNMCPILNSRFTGSFSFELALIKFLYRIHVRCGHHIFALCGINVTQNIDTVDFSVFSFHGTDARLTCEYDRQLGLAAIFKRQIHGDIQYLISMQ